MNFNEESNYKININSDYNPIIRFKKLDPNAIIPSYKHDGDSGFDFHSLYDYKLKPFEVTNIETGLSVDLPKNTLFTFELQIRPRSGLGKMGISIVNTPGTVDNGFTGMICILLIKLTLGDYIINPGDRIAQGVICPVVCSPKVKIEEVFKLSKTDRGENGWGSTGLK